MSGRTEFLGTTFDQWTEGETLAWLQGRTAQSDYAYLVTPNVDHLVRLEQAGADVRATYRATYADADVCLCDSRVVARLARLHGVHLPVVAGSDLVVAMFRNVMRVGDRICLIGGTPEDAAKLRGLYPAIDLVQHIPPMGLRRNPQARLAAAQFAVAAKARFTLIAVGSPQQELIAHELRALPGARGTALCIGAAVAFVTGAQTRAPEIVRRFSLEWAWRLASDPRRLAKRYLVDDPAIFSMTWHWARARRRQRKRRP